MKFSEIPGQVKIKQRLIQSVKENRVSHAQLFLGPEGSGALALAIAYGQYINCANRTPNDSCGECPSCKKYNKLIHPDLHFLYPVNKTKDVDEKKVTSLDFIPSWREFLLENNGFISLPDWYEKIGIEKRQGFISADDADSINHILAYKAYESEYKVMIIWMVEKMNTVAANKLLKNLEEPSDKTLFILVSENHDQVISTIISRTQLVKIPRLDEVSLAESLRLHFQLSEEIANKFAWQAEGNYRIAISLAGASLGETLTDDTEKEKFILFRDWMRRVYVFGTQQKDYQQLQDIISRLVGDGSREKQKEFLGYSLKILRLCMMYHVGNRHLVFQTGEALEFISKFSPYVHPRNIQKMDEEFNKAIFHIERNANAQLIFTDLSHILSRLIKIPAQPQIKKM